MITYKYERTFSHDITRKHEIISKNTKVKIEDGGNLQMCM
jgi:hypothetical protein